MEIVVSRWSDVSSSLLSLLEVEPSMQIERFFLLFRIITIIIVVVVILHFTFRICFPIRSFIEKKLL